MAARVQPRWERIQRAKGAAVYAGYPNEREFLKAVSIGEMPPPFDHAGNDAWDLVEIDASIDAIKAGTGRSYTWKERAPDRV